AAWNLWLGKFRASFTQKSLTKPRLKKKPTKSHLNPARNLSFLSPQLPLRFHHPLNLKILIGAIASTKMYGQGHYAPQFGQSPNRPPRPPFVQQQVSHASAPAGLIQQGSSVSPHGVVQPVGQQAHTVSPGDSAYHSAPMAQSCSSTSMPRTGQSYPPQATTGQNNTTVMHSYLSAQQGAQSAQYFSQLPPPPSHSGVPPPPPSQSQNIYRHPIHQPLPSLQQISIPQSALVLPAPPPRPMLSLQTSSFPSPAILLSAAPSTSGRVHTSSVASKQPPLPPSPPPFPPPPPPPSSTLQPSFPVSSKTLNSGSVQSHCDPSIRQAETPESVQNIPTRDRNRGSAPDDASNYVLDTKVVEASTIESGISSMPSDTLDVPTPPPRPTNEKTLRNIEILCQYISQNGPAFEDMARQKESGNLAFQFLFGGEPGSEAATEREYYLWMKNKLCLGQSKSNLLLKDKHDENRSSVEPNKDPTYSLTDSDMDMEDDIIQPCEKPDVHDQVSGLKPEFVSAVNEIEKNDQDNLLQSSRGGISTMYSGPPINSGGDDGGRSNRTVGSKTQTEDPFRLFKDYSSDESSEGDAREPVSTLQFHEAVAVASGRCKMQDSSESEATRLGHSESHMKGAQCKQHKDFGASLAPEISANELIPGPSSLEKKSDVAVESNVRAYASKQSDSLDLEERDALESSGVGLVSDSGKDQRVHPKSSASVKVDEFGRLIREGASETDSDDSSHYRRRGRRGSRRSSSRSPPKRRRRSPWRRKERRSLSRSWSPKRRRSRSRSPIRRPIDSSNQKNARGRHQTGECFNFLKGRCFRGASCKYLHSDPDKYGDSRQYRSKHHASETRTSSRAYDHSEENEVTIKKGTLDSGSNGKEMQNDKVKDEELKANQKQHADSVYASERSTVHETDRLVYVDGLTRDLDASSSCLPSRASHSIDVSDLFNSNLQKDKKPEQPMSCGNDEHVGHSQTESLKQEHHALDNQPQHLRSSYPTSAVQISAVSCQPSETVVVPCTNSVELVGQKDLPTSNSSAFNYPNHITHLQPPMRLPLPPPPPPSLHAPSIPHIPQPMQDYFSVPSEPNVLFSNQHIQFHPPQNLSWGNFPPQRPPYILTPPLHGGPASFQQGGLPIRCDPLIQPSLKTKPADLPIHPQESYMSIQGSHQPLKHVDSLPPGNHLGQPLADTLNSTSARDDPFINSLSSGPFSSSTLPHGNIPPLPASSLGEANSNRVQSLAHKTLLSGEPSSSSFQNPPYLQQQQPYAFYQAAGDNFRDSSHFSADFHKNNPLQVFDTGSRITAHYNPYASTFDQPLASNFSSDVFRQGNKTSGSEHENSYSLARAPFEGQNVAYGASPVIPSPHSSRAGGQTLAKSGGDQYDPLFDSIEPSAESLKKPIEPEDRAADNSDIMLRLSGSMPVDLKVKRKKKVVGVDSAATSSETDEFGETDHAEVIAVEAGSQSNLNDSAEGSAGEVEIDQVKREGKSKKNKDSRSMKLFKVELASFVKDMLKPSWRQGNMSKEAFKTIVKKTVEKVSGAMKGHRVPKSKAKIDQYIDRSQRKLTALVEVISISLIVPIILIVLHINLESRLMSYKTSSSALFNMGIYDRILLIAFFIIKTSLQENYIISLYS
ncbi:hypothetical protein V2J09_020434, partial [Rumex salicifolius]